MINRLLLPVLVTTASAAFLFAGCGGSSSSNNNNGNGNPDASSNTKPDSGGSSSPDGGGSSSPDGGGQVPEGGTPPSGTQLVPSSTASIVFDGLTNDATQLAIYTDTSANTLYAIPITGGTPTEIGAIDSNNDVLISGNLVFFQTASDSNGFGGISVWKSGASSPTVLSTSGTLQGGVTVSTDGTSAILFDNVNTTSQAGDLVAETVDGKTKGTLVSGVDLSGNSSCFPISVFAGVTAVVAYCPTSSEDAGTPDSGADGGAATTTAVVDAWSGTGWGTKVTIESAAQSFLAADPKGQHLLVVTSAGLVIVGPDGTGAATIDATGTSGTFSADSSTVFYTTSGNALKSYPVAGGSATALASTDFAQIQAISSDSKWAIGTLSAGGQGGFGLGDLYLVSTSATGAPHSALTLASSNAGVFGDAFTADNTYATFYTVSQGQTASFMVMPTSGTGTAATISSNADVNTSLTGTKVLLAVNPTGGQGSQTRADLEPVDVASPSGATVLVSQADDSFAVTSDKTKVVYSWSYAAGSLAGLWIQTVP